MQNFLKKIIEETDNVYAKQVKEMFEKTNANQYY